MPKHPSNGSHAAYPDSPFSCLGSGASLLETDAFLAKQYLSDLKTNHSSLSDSENRSNFGFINTLEARIERYGATRQSAPLGDRERISGIWRECRASSS